jgi:hypothetical protein
MYVHVCIFWCYMSKESFDGQHTYHYDVCIYMICMIFIYVHIRMNALKQTNNSCIYHVDVILIRGHTPAPAFPRGPHTQL